MSQPADRVAPDIESLRIEVAAMVSRSRVGGLFYLAGWLLVAAASQGFVQYPMESALLAGAFAMLALLRFVLRPALGARREVLVQLRRLHWAILLLTAVIWGAGLAWVLIEPAFTATRPAAVVCSILFATALAHSYPMSLAGSLLCMSFVYLPAPLLVDEGEGGRPVQLALGIYALYLVATALRAHREYREHLALQGALRGQRDRFEKLSQHDGLTGLMNHAEFATRLARVAEQCRRSGQGASLLLLDIDHFKQVNDRLGHLVGDEVLRAFATRLRRHFAPIGEAVVARWGGEEFAVLWPGAPLQQAAAQAEAFLGGLRTMPLLGDGQRVTASAGVGQLVPGGAPSALIAAVDRALYRAKAEGRDRVVVDPVESQVQDGASSP